MKDNWKSVRSKINDNIKEIFESSSLPSYANFDEALELFRNVLFHKTGIKKLDGLSDSIFEALFEIYFTKPGGNGPVEILVNNIEAFLKKIIFIIRGVDYSNHHDKNLMWCIKELGLLKEITPGIYPQLNEANIPSFVGQPYFLNYVCKAYVTRNLFHNAPKLKAVEVYQIVESSLVVYLFAILENYSQLVLVVGASRTVQSQLDTYRKHTLTILSYNPSLKMLESDFGIKIDSFDDFEIKIKAKARRRKEEKDEYLRESSKFPVLPIKFLPEIEGVMSNAKYILLHGIATSGKSTILKKLGKDFLDKYSSPYLFYFELGEIFKKKNGYTIHQEILQKFKEISSIDLDIELITEKILVLLDGLDEIPNKESRDIIIQQILDLKTFNNIQVILTSRTNDYVTNDTTIESYFEKFELLPITPSEIVALGEKILGHGSQFNNFVKMVKKGNLLKAFPKTPLTSILLAILFKEKDINLKELPKNITELYRKFIDLFLNRWDKSKGISEQFEIQKKEFVLQTIAEHMQKNRLISIPESELENFVAILAKKKNIGGPSDPKIHLKNLCERTGILVKDDFHDKYRFFHLTIQEYLAAQKLDYKDDDLLVENFFDEWWLNPNIFYAGNKTDYPDILQRISKFEMYPVDPETKFNYIAHSSQVLLAAHNIDNDIRESLLSSMIQVFDEFSLELVKELSMVPEFIDETISLDKKIAKFKNQTLLDVILGLRDIFIEFFNIQDFQHELINIWSNIMYGDKKIELSDTTLYCLSYCISIGTREAKYLEEFVTTNKIEINSRWYKIVDVDINIKNLQNTRKKIILKIRSQANKNKDYIQKQFKERISRHYESVTGIK
ncbi:MAG: NACHT domain-containing protein [Bacteroidales bacterium]